MLKKLIVLTVVFAVAAFAAYGPVPAPEGVEFSVAPVLPLRDGPITSTLFSTASPLVAGDQGGITMYDYQSNGAMGNRIAVDNIGDAQICWMHSEDENFVTRDIYYNAWEKASGEFLWTSGVKASGVPRAGYTTMGALSDGRAVIAFHHDPDGDGVHQSAIVIDAAPKLGAFSSPIDVDPLTVPEQPIWPRVLVDNNDVIHVTAHVYWDGELPAPSNYDYLYYSRSTDQGQTFSPWQMLAEDAGSDAAMTASKDGKVAIAWVFGFPIRGSEWLATHGNVKYVESTNGGATWSSAVEVTDGFYGEDQPNTRDTITLGAVANSIDCAYDAAGNLHIGWGDAWRSSYENPDDDYKPYYSFYGRWYQRMMHWSEARTDPEPTLASGPYTQFIPFDEEGNIIEYLDLGFWGIAQYIEGYIAPGLGCWNPQLAAIGSGDDMIFTWQGQWDSLDLSAGGTINADIYAAISTDGGTTWGPVADWTEQDLRERGNVFAFVTNVTNTHSRNAQPGYCESEEYHSAYPWIGSDSILHVTYIHDLFSGSVVQGGPAQGVALNNPVMYLGSKMYVGDGPPPLAVEEAPYVEAPVITLLGKHPVAGSVVFGVSATGTPASLKIYDAAGTLVKTLFEGTLDDARMLTWDASAAPAGVYFYSFVTPVRTAKGRVVVVH